jgi:hypothetical protein
VDDYDRNVATFSEFYRILAIICHIQSFSVVIAVTFSFKSSYMWTFPIVCLQAFGPQPGSLEYLAVFIVSLALISEEGS